MPLRRQRFALSVARVSRPIPILQSHPVCAVMVSPALVALLHCKMIYVQVIHVKRAASVHCPCPTLPMHASVKRVLWAINANEVKDTTRNLFVHYSICVGDPCLSSPCWSQAVCQPMWNATSTWFTCRCVGTFTGTRCETSLLNPCSGLCMNGYRTWMLSRTSQ